MIFRALPATACLSLLVLVILPSQSKAQGFDFPGIKKANRTPPLQTLPRVRYEPKPATTATTTTEATPATTTTEEATETSSSAIATATPNTGADVAPAQEFTEIKDEYQVKKGDDLNAIANAVYGNPSYHRVISGYNEINPKKMKVGQVLKTPSFEQMMRDTKVVPIMEEGIAPILEAFTQYRAIEDEMVAARDKGVKGNRGVIDDELKAKLLAVRELLAKGANRFAASGELEGVTKAPARVVNQLTTAAVLCDTLSKEQFGERGIDVYRVYQTHAYALMYAMEWARGGYK